MDAFDQKPAQTSTTRAAELNHPEPAQQDPVQSEDAEADVVEILPTMADLDRLAADLDRVDMTLVEIDAPAQPTS